MKLFLFHDFFVLINSSVYVCRRQAATVWVINLWIVTQFADSPEIRSRPSNIEADIGSNVTLRCDVDGNPEPEISWYGDSRRVLGIGPAYSFWMNHDTAGKYTCTARVPGFSEVSADAHVFLKGDHPNRWHPRNAWNFDSNCCLFWFSCWNRSTDCQKWKDAIRTGERDGEDWVRGFRCPSSVENHLDSRWIRSWSW